MTVAALEDGRLDETFAALANPVRRAILLRLVDGEASVNELAAPFELTLPAISRHIKVLEHAGLIARGRRAQLRPCRLQPAAFEAVSSWVDQYRPIWEQRFDRIDGYVEQLRQQKKGPKRQ